MIKFFRHIRKDLMEKNPPSGRTGKTGKPALPVGRYLKYAIGEIVLVVIGILIALQINNWNEGRKVLKIEQIILHDLKIEITSNIKGLEQATKSNRRSLKYAKILNDIYQNTELLNQYSGDSILKMTWLLPGQVFRLDNGILNSIISSGQINVIKNKEIKYKLSSLNQVTESSLGLTKQVESDGKEYFDKMIYIKVGSFIENGKLNNYRSKDMYKLPEFHIAIRGIYIERRKIALLKEEKLKIFYEDLLALIDSEIDSK